MCTIKFSIELNTFWIDDKDLTNNSICEKSVQISMSHQCSYASFLDDSVVRHLPGKVLTSISLYFF